MENLYVVILCYGDSPRKSTYSSADSDFPRADVCLCAFHMYYMYTNTYNRIIMCAYTHIRASRALTSHA